MSNKMNLNNFENFFDEKVLDRANELYISNKVKNLEKINDNLWVANIKGDSFYQISVYINGNEITSSSCDCPYDYTPYCKHQGAVFYQLREMELKPTTSKKESIVNIVNNLSKEKLVAILLEVIKKDKNLKNELLLKYSQDNNILEHSRKVIENSIDLVSRHGYVDYNDVKKGLKGAEIILDIVNNKISSGDTLTAISLCTIILEEVISLLGYCDDSSGYCGNIIYTTINIIEESIDNTIESNNINIDKLFEIVFDHATSAKYKNWSDWQINILSCLIPLCKNKINREKLENYLKIETSDENWHSKFSNEWRQEIVLTIIEKFDGEIAAIEYLESHLENDNFRKKVIKNALASKQYEKVIQLSLDGEKQSKDYQVLQEDYKKYRYLAYENTNQIQSQKELAYEMLLNNNFEYFNQLKKMYTDSEWEEILNNLLKITLETMNLNLYTKILVAENLTNKLLDYCQKDIRMIAEYASILLKDYPNETKELYEKYIFIRAEGASDRSSYKKICNEITNYITIIDKDVDKMVAKLKQLYFNRPAFLDELDKVSKKYARI